MDALLATVEMTTLVLLAAILAGPILGERFRVPGLLALIFLGMLFGPFGLGWLGRVDLVYDLGAIGILYLMFLAGLGFNLNAFNAGRASALGFGLLSFVFPFGLSLAVGLTWLEAGILGAAMLGSMWASNTLVAYPDVRAAGLEQTRAVRDAMSGGVVADMLSLLILAVATSYAVVETLDPTNDDHGAVPTLPLYLSIPVLVAFTLWVLPRLGRWFFVRVGHSRMQRLLFVLTAMAASATLAVVGGIAGIIGAFLAGIGLNRLVPNGSELMERVDFVGTSVFIPAFLVSIGLRIDPAALVDVETVVMGVAFLLIVMIGKGLAVLVATGFFKYTSAERGLIASLSIGQAASTLAVGQIGLELGLFDQRVVNASILTIVLAALLTSFGTQHFIARMPNEQPDLDELGARVLVDVGSKASQVKPMIHLAGRIAHGDDGVAIPFAVAQRSDKAMAKSALAQAEAIAESSGYDSTGVLRLSDSYVDGTIDLTDETEASLVVLGWQGPRLGADQIFGSELDRIAASSPVPTIAAHLTGPWDRVVVVPGAEYAPWQAGDVRLALEVAARLATYGGHHLPLLVIADNENSVREHAGERGTYEFVQADQPGEVMMSLLTPSDLVVAPAYLLSAMPVHRRLRLSVALAKQNLAIVSASGHSAVMGAQPAHAMDRLLGQHS